MLEQEINEKLKRIGKDVFISILYPALKKSFDIDYKDVCFMFPEYAKRVRSDKAKRTRLSTAKSILKGGCEKCALTIIAESNRLDEQLINKAKEYLALIK